MDSFSTIIIYAKAEETVQQTIVDEENGGGPANGLCVVAHVEADLPVNEENGGGPANGLCVVA